MLISTIYYLISKTERDISYMYLYAYVYIYSYAYTCIHDCPSRHIDRHTTISYTSHISHNSMCACMCIHTPHCDVVRTRPQHAVAAATATPSGGVVLPWF